jgi:hypothetical protein
MMACRVIVGEYCQGHKDALTPDVRDAKTHQLYDSTVNDGYNPSIYVTYNDAQAYPEVRNTGEGITTQRFTWHLGFLLFCSLYSTFLSRPVLGYLSHCSVIVPLVTIM